MTNLKLLLERWSERFDDAPEPLTDEERRGVQRMRWMFRGFGIASILGLLLFANFDQQMVLAPGLIVVNIALYTIVELYIRARRLPLFDLGTMFAAIMTLYTMVPLINYAGGGMRFHLLSDMRLQSTQPPPWHVTMVAWRYVVYVLAFTIAYLWMRRIHAEEPGDAVATPPLTKQIAVVILLASGLALFAFFHSMEPATAPLIVKQLFHITQSLRFTLKQALLILLLMRWHSLGARFLLIGWMIFEAYVAYRFGSGSRGETALLYLSAGLLYHRLVRPVTLRMATIGGTALLIAFLAVGYVRDMRHVRDANISREAVLSATNEFQALFSNAVDIPLRILSGMVRHTPWQVYYSELYMIIPSQLLPFEKIDPANWYAGKVLKVDIGKQGMLWGVIAQSTIGLDWIELILRGGVLGLIFAFIHRWYARRSHDFTAILVYLFFLIWTYYTFRYTTFFIAYMFVYYLLPVLIGIAIVSRILARFRGGALAKTAEA